MTALDTIKQAVLGVPFDPEKEPSRVGVVQAFSEMQMQMEGAQAGALVFDTIAAMQAVTAVPSANIMAWVMTGAQAGIYQNIGSSISPSWLRRGSIPQFLVTGINTGSGTPDAIQVTTDIPFPTEDGRAMLLVPILASNTISPPTISINGGENLPIVSNSGTNVVVNGFAANMIVAGFISGGKFRLISDQITAAMVAAADAAATRAENAAAGVTNPVSYIPQSLTSAQQDQVQANIRGIINYNTLAELQASVIPTPVQRVVIRERVSGKGGGATWFRATADASWPSAAKTQDASGNWWKLLVSEEITPEMLGAFPLVVCDVDTKAWYDACAVKPTFMHLKHMDLTIRILKWRGLWSKITQFLSIGGAAQADSIINVKSPGTKNATISGTGTFIPGVGYKGDGVSGHINIGPWNGLLSQNAAFILTCFLPTANSTGNLVSSIAGVSGNVTINPSTGASAVVRLNSSTASTTPRDHRSGSLLVARDDAATVRLYEDGELLANVSAASASVTSGDGSLLRSGSAFSAETICAFVCGNVALGRNHQDADELALIMKMHVDGLAGVVGKGPSCDNIGFTSSVTDANRLIAMNQCVELASMFNAKIKLNIGCYSINDTFAAFKQDVTVFGVSKEFSIICCGNTFPVDAALVSPGHFNGGEKNYELSNMTLDMRCDARGITTVGTVRPGPSAANTVGSTCAKIHDLIIIDPQLHGIDDCNTGELSIGGVRNYDPSPTPTKFISGIPSKDSQIYNIIIYGPGDDGVSSHYSNGRNGFIRNIAGYFPNHRNSLTANAVVEIDDGAMEYNVSNVYGRGFHGVAAAKNHVPCPSPRLCNFDGIVSERCGRIIYFGDGNMIGNNGHTLRASKLTRPWTPSYATNQESARPFTVWGVSDIDIEDFYVSARGDANEGAPLYSVLQFANGAKRIRISGGSIVNWAARADLSTPSGATIRSENTIEDLSIHNVHITGARTYGIYDTGSLRPDYDRITIGGTGVAGSYPVRLLNKSAQTTRALKTIGTYSAGVSGFENPSDV